jgi:hypothetical protein
MQVACRKEELSRPTFQSVPGIVPSVERVETYPFATAQRTAYYVSPLYSKAIFCSFRLITFRLLAHVLTGREAP